MPDPYWEKVGEEIRKNRSPRMFGIPLPPKNSAGNRAWACSSCKFERREHWLVLNRSARPRCPECGSLTYEPKTKEAKKAMAGLRGVRGSFKGPRGTGRGKFVIQGG